MDKECEESYSSDEDEVFTLANSDPESQFYEIIGCIEDILIDDEFSELQNAFLDKYWMEFEDVEENKFIYMDIFQEYTQAIEAHLASKLESRIPNFDMHQFESELISQNEELQGEVFEILSTLTNFNEFKAMFLDFRATKQGKIEDLSDTLCVTSYKQ